MTGTVLVVEDDEDVRETTRLVLEKQGFTVHTAVDGVAGYDAARGIRPDVAIVDVAMPRMDGLTLTRLLTAEEICPVLLLTARDLPDDQITGFDAGAWDYVIKPFDSRVLAARLRSLVRRAAEPAGPERIGPLSVDRPARTVTRDGVAVPLTPTEFDLLTLLADHSGIVLSRRMILQQVWGGADWTDEHLVNVNIQRMRTKIGPGVITTVRGFGYRVDAV